MRWGSPPAPPMINNPVLVSANITYIVVIAIVECNTMKYDFINGDCSGLHSMSKKNPKAMNE